MSFSVLKKCHTFAEATMLADDIVDRFADLESIGTLATTQHPDEVQQCATDILTIQGASPPLLWCQSLKLDGEWKSLALDETI